MRATLSLQLQAVPTHQGEPMDPSPAAPTSSARRAELEPVAKLLRTALAASGHVAADLAAVVGASRSAASRWTTARAAPSDEALEAAADLTGLPMIIFEQALNDPEDALDPFAPETISAHLEATDLKGSAGYPVARDQLTDNVGVDLRDADTSSMTMLTGDMTMVLPDGDGTVRDVNLSELVSRWISTNGDDDG